MVRVIKDRKRRGLPRHALLQQVMRHLLLARRPEVALIICRKPPKKRRVADDAGIGRDSERLGDLRRDQDLAITLTQPAGLRRSKRRRKPQRRATDKHTRASRRGPSQKLPAVRSFFLLNVHSYPLGFHGALAPPLATVPLLLPHQGKTLWAI